MKAQFPQVWFDLQQLPLTANIAHWLGHVDGHPVEPLLDPPEPELLLPPELEVPAVMQSEPMHDWPCAQTWHALPADPQLLSSDVPAWQLPLVSQHPEHVEAHVLPGLPSSPLLLPPASVPPSSPVGSDVSSPDEPDEDDGIVASSPPDDEP
jgi:hypothetical protein